MDNKIEKVQEVEGVQEISSGEVPVSQEQWQSPGLMIGLLIVRIGQLLVGVAVVIPLLNNVFGIEIELFGLVSSGWMLGVGIVLFLIGAVVKGMSE